MLVFGHQFCAAKLASFYVGALPSEATQIRKRASGS
jgi:hypothetical protein